VLENVMVFSAPKRHHLGSKALLSMIESDGLGAFHGYSMEMKCIYAEGVCGE